MFASSFKMDDKLDLRLWLWDQIRERFPNAPVPLFHRLELTGWFKMLKMSPVIYVLS